MGQTAGFAPQKRHFPPENQTTLMCKCKSLRRRIFVSKLARGNWAWFKNTMFVVSHSDMYIVSIQQTLYSALSRGSGAQKLILRKGFNLAHRSKFCALRKT